MASCSPCRDRGWGLDCLIQEESEGKAMFTGSLVALITPFKNGSVDEKGFEKFVAWQIKEGTDGLVPCGTTGESPTLSIEEHKRVIDICIAAAKGTGVPVIAGTGSNSTDEAIELTRARQEGRRRRRHAGRALLQQADPGRPVPALQGGGRGGRHPDPALQRAAAHRRRHAGRDGGPPVAGQEHHRHQGRELRHGAPDPDQASGQEGLPASSRARMPAPWASWRRAATAASR